MEFEIITDEPLVIDLTQTIKSDMLEIEESQL